MLLVGDGMADFPIAELGNKTPLEYAATPAMDSLAYNGYCGSVRTIPDSLAPGSDVANLSLMGYDPAQFYGGRAPIEAVSMGVALQPGDVAFRCNLVALANDLMEDYSCGHIETVDAHAIIAELKAVLDNDDVSFYPGVSYRHLMVMKNGPSQGLCSTPPHDITGKQWRDFLPTGTSAERIISLMDNAREVLKGSVTNKLRREKGKKEVTDIWLWGQGSSIVLPTIAKRFGLRGSVISAVDLIHGIGMLAGLTSLHVAGATGYLNTNYAGKVATAQAALGDEDFVFLHVEAPDEVSHEGSLQKKIQAIEEFDSKVVAEMARFARDLPAARILIAPDHATPLSLKTHHRMSIPFAVRGTGIAASKTPSFCESSAPISPLFTGESLFSTFITGDFFNPL